MSGALIALLFIVTISLLVVRIGATALMMTGLTWDTASFQAYSAFFGVGFTTKEAEMVVNHPIRRRIIRTLILVGNVGLTSALASLIVTFVQSKGTVDVLASIGIILAGAVFLVIVSRLGAMRNALDFLIRRSLEHAGVVRAMDYDLLLRVKSGYSVSEVDILDDCKLASQTLGDSRPADDGLVVLGILKSDGAFIGAPGPSDRIESGDVITVYGKDEAIDRIARSEK